MIPLPTVHPDLLSFGSAARPLRPSRVAKFVRCPMSVALTFDDTSAGNRAAQTGNIVHDMAETFHKHQGTLQEKIEAGRAALDAARLAFPEGDADKAVQVYCSYVADPTNQAAVVEHCEAAVTLTLPAEPYDPTGEPIVINGTLDQVRRLEVPEKIGDRLFQPGRYVWDIKTGDSKKPDEYIAEYLIQQAVYVLAARQTLHEDIQPGGLIWTPGYFSARSRIFLPLPLTVESCKILVAAVPPLVACVRSGRPVFLPAADTCKFCDFRPFPRCESLFHQMYGVKNV